MYKGWLNLDGKRYYLDKNDGSLTKGIKNLDGHTFYFDQKE